MAQEARCDQDDLRSTARSYGRFHIYLVISMPEPLWDLPHVVSKALTAPRAGS